MSSKKTTICTVFASPSTSHFAKYMKVFRNTNKQKMYTNHKRQKKFRNQKSKNLLYINQLYIYLLQKKIYVKQKKNNKKKNNQILTSKKSFVGGIVESVY